MNSCTVPATSRPPSGDRPTQALLASAYVRGLCEALRFFGHDADRLIKQAGIAPGRLADGWFAVDEVDQLLGRAVALSGDPALGLHWAERSTMMQFDLGPSLFATAPSLRDGLEAVLRLQLMFASRAQCFLREQERRSELTFELLATSELGLRVVTELTLVSIQRGFRYLGQLPAIRSVNVVYARPAHGAEYERLFGGKVRFGQPQTSIVFASSALDYRKAMTNEPLHQLLREHTETESKRAMAKRSQASHVEDHVRLALPRLPLLAEVAQTLEVSTRTLRRQLLRESTSFHEIVDRVQRERALELMELGQSSVKEVAHASGFRSSSGFHRAYRRWTGTTPAKR